MKAALKFFGIPVADNVNVSDITMAFHGMTLGTAFIIAAIAIAATFWVYFTTTPKHKAWQKGLLSILRSLLILMILLLLMKPVLLLTVEGTVRRSLLLLIDGSASMQIKDLRQDPDDLKRAAMAKGLLDPRYGLKQGLPSDTSSIEQLSRADVLKAMLTNEKLDLLGKLGKTYDLVPYTFGQSLQALSGPDASGKQPERKEGEDASKSFLNAITFDRPYTAIGDAVRTLLDLKRGQPVAGILVVTDGGNNYGSQPADAAALAQQDKVPVFVYGVGISSPHDIIVSQVYSPEVVFAKEDATATVTLHSQSMNGRTTKMVLKMGDQVMDTKDVTFGEDGEQTVTMHFLPPAKGEYELEASIDPLPDEAVKDNNKASQRVRVIDGKIQVLYIEQKPRWEFRFLQAMMVRDRRLEAHYYLVDGDSDISKEEGSPYLPALPATKEEWMKYDVVIVGDVNSRIFNDLQMQSVSDLVSTFGGGAIFIAGHSFMPDSYRRTPLENLFPIVFEGQSASAAPASTKLVPLELTPAGANSPTMRLADKESENTSVWKGFTGIYWDTRITKAKPAAEVLLADPSPEKATRNGAMPVIALQSYGTGQVMFVGTDETWRWRRNIGEKFYTRFWGQVMLRLGLPRLLGASRLTQLATERKHYVSGERVVISGRLYKSGFQPVIDPTVKGSVTIKPDDASKVAAGDLHKDINLQATPSRPGYYEGELIVTTPGVYSFASSTDPASAIEFKVTEPKFEFGETALNVGLLQKMADTSGGAFYREETIYKLLESASSGGSSPAKDGSKAPPGLGEGTIKVPSPEEVDMAFSPLYYAIMILVATIEWGLRKLWALK